MEVFKSWYNDTFQNTKLYSFLVQKIFVQAIWLLLYLGVCALTSWLMCKKDQILRIFRREIIVQNEKFQEEFVESTLKIYFVNKCQLMRHVKNRKKQFEIFLERRNDTGKIFHFEPSPHKIKKILQRCLTNNLCYILIAHVLPHNFQTKI